MFGLEIIYGILLCCMYLIKINTDGVVENNTLFRNNTLEEDFNKLIKILES